MHGTEPVHPKAQAERAGRTLYSNNYFLFFSANRKLYGAIFLLIRLITFWIILQAKAITQTNFSINPFNHRGCPFKHWGE
jgi:hypothetical protein